MIYNEFFFSKNRFLQPCYSISPFRTQDIEKNQKIVSSRISNSLLDDYFRNRKYAFTINGRTALNSALKSYRLNPDDNVTIITTSNNYYVSSCVTMEIEKFCKWSRKIEDKTRILLVIHEFGFPIENLSGLVKHGLPIIEDCAFSFASQNAEGSVGKIGECVIYSISKFFPIQFGGILLYNRESSITGIIEPEYEEYLFHFLSYYMERFDQIVIKRQKNYRYLKKILHSMDIYPRFELKHNYCPGVFMFRIESVNLRDLKIYMQNHGVEVSIFYNEDTFFVPINQSLDIHDLDYIKILIENFINTRSSI